MSYEFDERELHPDGYRRCEECSRRLNWDEDKVCGDCAEEMEVAA